MFSIFKFPKNDRNVLKLDNQKLFYPKVEYVECDELVSFFQERSRKILKANIIVRNFKTQDH